MANDENTAVNELIARLHGGQTSPRADLGPSTASLREPPPDPGVTTMQTTIPFKMPVAAPYASPAWAQPAQPGQISSARAPAPPSPPAPGAWREPPNQPLNASPPPRLARSPSPESFVGTIRVRHPSERQTMFNKLVLPMALLVVVGMLAGGYVAMHSERAPARRVTAKPAPAAVAPAAAVVAAAPAVAPTVVPVVEPVPAAAPTVVPVVEPAPAAEPAPAPAAALVDVRIDSTPRGATVTLVDRGKTQLVGNTPISVAFDPSREYDLVFSYPNKPTKIEHLNASATHKVLVALDATASEPAAIAPAPAPAPAAPPARVAERHAPSSRRASHASAAAVAPALAPALADDASDAPAAAELGEGTLMVSSKPPCEILIDGRATGLTTPQKRIPLTAGPHKVTLLNSERGIKKTVSVQIEADDTKKVIQDFLE